MYQRRLRLMRYFVMGEYVTNEQMNDKKFLKLVGR